MKSINHWKCGHRCAKCCGNWREEQPLEHQSSPDGGKRGEDGGSDGRKEGGKMPLAQILGLVEGRRGEGGLQPVTKDLEGV